MRLIAWIILLAVPFTAMADVAMEVTPSGLIKFDNGLFQTDLSPKPGRAEGFRKWTFTPTGHDMVNVLYGQTDYVTGGLLGEIFDKVAVNAGKESETYGVVAGGSPPITTTFYVTDRAGIFENGRAALVQQTAAAGGYKFTRTVTVRRDLAAVEVHYTMENIGGPRMGTTLRLFSAISPGARRPIQDQNHMVYMPMTDGVASLDQAMPLDRFMEKYGQTAFCLPQPANSPRPHYATSPRQLLAAWSAMVQPKNGDGMTIVGTTPNFMGFYGSPGTTYESFFAAADLAPGLQNEYGLIVGSFTGAAGASIANATGLYVATEPLKLEAGALVGKVIPYFKGKLQLINQAGATVGEWPASPDAVLAVQGTVGEGWSIKAIDTKGQEIGTVDAKGQTSLAAVDIPMSKVEPPAFEGKVYVGDEKMIADFIAPRDFTVYCDDAASRREKKVAKDIAAKLGVGITWSPPYGKVLVIGEPSTNSMVGDVGKLRHSFSAEWPGAERGALVGYSNFELTANPILLIAGGDDLGVVQAAAIFSERFLKDAQPPKGLALWVPAMEDRIYPFSRAPANPVKKIVASAARGEYESAMVAFTANETARDIKVSVSPLKNHETGAAIGSTYLTKFRQKNGPVWVRWVNYYPVKRQGGWPGYPDPLLEQADTLVPGGESRALWLTFIVPDDAPAGMYDAELTVTTSIGEQKLPIQLEVYNFTIPQTGLQGHPYMAMELFAPEGQLTERQVQPLVSNLVEHGMRLITPSGRMFGWSYSPQGEFKGFKADNFEVSEDGKVMLDASGLDTIISQCDKAAKPFPISFVINAGEIVGGFSTFRKTLPNRYPDKEAVPGKESVSKSWYAVEMYQLAERYIKRKGLMDRVLVKVADEPAGFDPWYDNSCWAIRKTELPIFTAMNSISYKDAERGFNTQIKLWQPLYHLHDQAFLDKAKANGAKVSWYNCGPPPRTSVGEVRSALRSYLWQAAKADLDVISWWGVQCWWQAGGRQAVWEDRYAHWHSLIYPAHPSKPPILTPDKGWIDNGPIDSIRWELIRDGMDDASYVKKLRELIAIAEKSGQADLANQGKATLTDIWDHVFPTLNDYRPPYDKIVESRDRVARMIVTLQSGLNLQEGSKKKASK